MVTGKIKVDMSNTYGKAIKGSECEILKVWLNHQTNNVYCEISFANDGITIITSIKNIEIG